jgi:hypothetical protein
MKLKYLLGLALVLSGGLFGCSTAKINSSANVASDENIKLPIRFKNYRELYAFIEATTYGGQPTNADTTLAMASDTTTEIVTLSDDRLQYVYLVTPHYYDGGGYDHIRGEQGNGDYYILRPLTKLEDFTGDGKDHGFELVGIGEGNSFTWTNSNGKIGFVTTWHLSARENPASVYEWNGKFFEQVK